MNSGDRIHHIAYGYGHIELVLSSTECVAYFAEYGARDMEPTYRKMEELYGRPFERVPNQALNVVQVQDFHNCTATGIY